MTKCCQRFSNQTKPNTNTRSSDNCSRLRKHGTTEGSSFGQGKLVFKNFQMKIAKKQERLLEKSRSNVQNTSNLWKLNRNWTWTPKFAKLKAIYNLGSLTLIFEFFRILWVLSFLILFVLFLFLTSFRFQICVPNSYDINDHLEDLSRMEKNARKKKGSWALEPEGVEY